MSIAFLIACTGKHISVIGYFQDYIIIMREEGRPTSVGGISFTIIGPT